MHAKSDNAAMTRLRQLAEALAPERRTRVIDIGANPLDETPYSRLLRLNLCDVWGFEPQKEAYRQLVEAAGPHEKYVECAVGDGERSTLRVCQSSGMTSMLKPNQSAIDYLGRFEKALKVAEHVEIATRRLDDLNLPQADLLKIDIQGSECAVFRNGRTMLSGGVAVITEVAAIPLYEDQPLLDEQMRVLAESGYSLHKFLFFKSYVLNRKHGSRFRHRMASQLIDGDAVFIRNLLNLPGQETEWLKHLAILSDGVFQSLDLAVVVLTLLQERGVVDQSFVEYYVSAVTGSDMP